MVVTFPHMGTVEIMLRDLVTRLGADYVTPPPTTNRTLRIGTKYSPEFACLPLKVTVGNLIEGLEAGADTLVMAGGCGPCRFGYYAEIQKRILSGLGYEFKFVTFEPPGMGIIQFYKAFKKIAKPGLTPIKLWKLLKTSYRKARFIDQIDKWSIRMRPFEAHRGEVSKYKAKSMKIMEKAFSLDEIIKAEEEICHMIKKIEMDYNRSPLQIGFLGEFYMLLEPYINYDIEEFLGYRGVSLEKAVYLTDWLGPGRKNPVSGKSNEEIIKIASPYLNHRVGGEGQLTIGHIISMAEEGFDGAIHIMPFTCMPETIAKSIMPKVQKSYDFPLLTLVIDEQTAKAGLVTRLEAFIDLLLAKKSTKNNNSKFYFEDKGGLTIARFLRN